MPPPRGAPLENDDVPEPLIGETLGTNQLVLNLGLTKLAVQTVDVSFQRVFSCHDDALDAL
jgi:hypothetical protein